MSSDRWITQVGALGVLVTTFVAVSHIARTNEAILASIVHGGNVSSVIGFILLTALFVVFVIPLDIVFLIPLGALVWGPVPTALMSITGWVLGSIVALGIARSFGAPVVEKLVGLKRIRSIETRIPKQNLFWTVVFLRLVIPVDILSYALGLFSTMAWRPYVLATLIGVTPFGFYFSYAGTLPFWYQIAAMGGALILATAILFKYGTQKNP
jgi:uncharacterized membrane protein YdjX (TVP38/TMEM64 family)